ncbi:MAG: hypothetical protein HYV05_14150 [Deltaproteobacteria bacterium]|nr:hypothetical protein [Deltaproteobacteria bacterium]MBI2349780.1 hypothetical protein [Deltaproteobacteria bacterium]MBI3060418.1 hypothetical protein [Deltaproteobacteria bacterium]
MDESRTVEEVADNDAAKAEPAERRPSRLPLILTIASLLVWFGFQTVQLVVERGNLSLVKGNLEAPMQESQKVRAQLEAVINKTAELAKQGNANAKMVIEELEKRGIPIRAIGQAAK